MYNWSDYIDEAVLDAFTEETGIRVVYDLFDSNEVLETKLLTGGTGYDIVVPTRDLFTAPDRRWTFPAATKRQAP